MKPFDNYAFAAVPKRGICPAPHDLYIYKLCGERIGIATDRGDFRPFPTDYLYVVVLADENKVR